MESNAPRIDLRTDPNKDPRLSIFERGLLDVIGNWAGVALGRDDIGFPTLSQLSDGSPRLTLEQLVQSGKMGSPHLKPQIFHAVARLEDFGYLPVGAIR